MSAPELATEWPADLVSLLADRSRAAALLIALAERQHDERFARAAGVLRGRHCGRKPCDDRDALRQVRDLLASGDADSVEQAARWVSRTRPGHSATATAARLARKYRNVKID